MVKNVELERQKSKAKFSIAASSEYNVTFKTNEEKLKLIEKLFIDKQSYYNSVSTLGTCLILTQLE